ncbi:MAG TPA: phage terminase large subunit [Candidatus Gastranaerophilales bacterium]|nr:phage terminase large subunit [Candidatus Gastranaerophilales bacterium]
MKKLDIPTLKAIYQVTILENPYIPVIPTDKQLEFLLNFDKEILYGGAAGGGKSAALLMAALMFVEDPDYKGLILRRTYSQLTLPGALMDMSFEWLGGTDAKWCGQEKQWIFPSGATLNFGYLDAEQDKYRYQGAAFHFVGFDELTQFSEAQYTYLFSRTRKMNDSKIPLRFRSASNPGGIGHEWVKDRFITQNSPERKFVPATIQDNPHLEKESYLENLSNLDPVTRKQLQEGNWDVIQGGNFFRQEKFEVVDIYPKNAHSVRYWDLAATQECSNKDSDYTAGVKICEQNGIYWIVDVIRKKLSPAGVESLIRQTAELDGIRAEIFMEQEPGSSGLNTISHYARNILAGYCFKGVKSTGSKILRAKPLASAVENNNVKLVRGAWNREFINECAVFPQKGFHDDMVDAASGAFQQLQKGGAVQISSQKLDRSSGVTRGY